MASEVVREKILENTRQEIPHSIGVVVQEFKDDGTILKIRADIIVERSSQKPIILGKAGSMIKKSVPMRGKILSIFSIKRFSWICLSKLEKNGETKIP